ncbi:UPF0729 protein CG18508 [Athalia rosae]|uniref:UPF0729 protein CG18508 n=1 Tax=Athalia rosae TaxID=37344 RepID=UPI002033BBCD|nr:UPF0729 protein CG18508 [Athalia rosae]
MVCVPCVIAPVVLLLWRYLIQPLLIRLWNFWRNIKSDNGQQVVAEPPQLVKECNEGGCKLSWAKNQKSVKVE